jgi:UDP-3-O-[3-hydroxymyristoyl] glucosamine N-acyltransferase
VADATKILTLSDLADLVGGRLEGDSGRRVTGVAPLSEAEGSEVAFFAARRYTRFLAHCQARAYLVSEELEALLPAGADRVVVSHPHRALRKILEHFHPESERETGVHPTAVLGTGVWLGEAVSVGPFAVLEDEVSVGDRTRVGAHCFIGRGSRIGEDCLLHPQVVAYADTSIGDRVTIHSGARLGPDGFGFTEVEGEQLKIPQVGRCVIGDDVEIGANSTIDRGSLGDTVLGRGVKLDNLVHIAHNVRVGAHSLLAALVGIAGSSRLGKGVWVGGQAGVSSHLEVGDGAKLAIATKLMRDVPAGETVSGHPGRPHREQMRKQAHLGRIEKLMERVRILEREVGRRGGHDDDSGSG